jgi:hypothetical protein
MTEEEWLTSGDWLKLWFHSDEVGLLTDRKTRLFAAAACRRFVHRLVDPRCLRAVEVCERYADGRATDRALSKACAGAKFDSGGPPVAARSTVVGEAASAATHWICYETCKVGRCTECAPSVHAYEAAIAAGLMAEDAVSAPGVRSTPAYREGLARGERIQADILREVIGNPFRPVVLDPAWQAPAIVSLARAAYDDRLMPSGELSPERLAVLSDALEEAEAPAVLLEHLRSPGPHVRGCFVVDLIVGKA